MNGRVIPFPAERCDPRDSLDRLTERIIERLSRGTEWEGVYTAPHRNARQQKGALDAANKASEIKVRAERRIGELLKAVPRPEPSQRGQGRPPKSLPTMGADSAEIVRPKTPLREVIERAEITPRMAEDCQKLAEIPAPMFEAAEERSATKRSAPAPTNEPGPDGGQGGGCA